jgi:UDP-2,3-diacylglucosamine pyrophosphatase LpxH
MYDGIHVSDQHCGSNACQEELFIWFLEELPPTKRLVLGGDLLDSVYPRLNTADWHILRLLRDIGQRVIDNDGSTTQVIHIRGNHDWTAQDAAALINAPFLEDYIYQSGPRKVYTIHGHQFDHYMASYPTLTAVGNWLNGLLATIDAPLATWLKRERKILFRADDQVQIGTFDMMRKHGCDIGFAGHTHYMRDVVIGEHRYCNTGAWADNQCPAFFVSEGEVVSHIYE